MLAACLLAGMLSGCSGSLRSQYYPDWQPKTSFDPPAAGYVQVAQDGGTTLEVDPSTMDIRLTKDGAVWQSRPFTSESASVKDIAYDSLFVINGCTAAGNAFVLDSWVDCIARRQYEVTVADGRLTGVFTVGNISARIILPVACRQETFEEQILNRLEESRRRRVLRRYTLWTLDDCESEDEKQEMLKEYPALKDQALYIVNNGVTERERKEMAEYAAEAGYTETMLDAEYAAVGYKEEEIEADPVFELTLTLSLQGGDLIVEVPSRQIYYDTGAFVLNKLDVLRSLACADAGIAREILIPDGSGALIDLTQDTVTLGKVTKSVYSGSGYVDNLYGAETASLPVFGFSKGETALFAIIEDGDALAEINADYNGGSHAAYPTFVHQDIYSEATKDGWKYIVINKYNTELPDTTYRVRYCMMTGGATGYTDMANTYRAYLDAAGGFGKLADKTLPLYVETLGSVNVHERVLFFPVNHEVALTTLEQDQQILRTLREQGVKNVRMRLTGALNGGLMNSLNDGVRLSGAVGGKGELKKLLDYAAESGYTVYPNAEFTRVYKNGWFDGFNALNDAGRGLDDQYLSASTRNLATGKRVEDSFAYLLSPTKLPSVADRYLKKSGSLFGRNLSAGALGETILENYRSGDVVNRQQAKQTVRTVLAAMAKDNSVMLSGANAYVLPYADHLLNLPVGSSRYGDYAAEVPFLQMVLHGRVNYALEALNMTADYRYTLLKSIETGGGVHVVLVGQNASKLRSTPFSYYLSVDQDYWLPIAAQAYKKADQAVGDVVDQAIVDHRMLADQVFITVYEGGKQIVTNYNDKPVTVGGLTVEAMDYAVASYTAQELEELAPSRPRAEAGTDDTDAPVAGDGANNSAQEDAAA